MLTIKIALLLILAYLLGSFPTGVIVGKVFFHKDIRKLGSGNPGSTNTFRTFGPSCGDERFASRCFKRNLSYTFTGNLSPWATSFRNNFWDASYFRTHLFNFSGL